MAAFFIARNPRCLWEERHQRHPLISQVIHMSGLHRHQCHRSHIGKNLAAVDAAGINQSH